MKILIVEDNKILNNNISTYLNLNDIKTKQLLKGNETLLELSTSDYDAIILDIGLPDINGLEICKNIREKGINTPILILTARNTTKDKVSGLNLGADDYLIKPFDYEELLARLKSLTRRNLSVKSDKIKLNENILIDLKNKKVFSGEENIDLSKLEFKLLSYLAENRGNIISKEKLLEKIWGEFDEFGNSRSVDVYVGYIRKKLGKDTILTERGLGYIVK